MQLRISQGPHAALAIAESASAEQVRQAFLQLTKQFHPARFGRMTTDVQRLANEVFLGIKAAHDQLTKLLGSSGRVAFRRDAPAPAVTADGTNKTRVVSAGTMPPVSRTRTASTPPMVVTPTGIRPTGQIPVRRTEKLPAVGPKTPTGGIPLQRKTPSGGIPVQSRTMTPTQPVQPRTTTPIRRPSGPIDPATIRYSGVQPTQPLPRAATPTGTSRDSFDETAELAGALEMLTARNWAAARQALHALAARVPQSKQYRALLCYTRGREAQAGGRNDEAVQELQRALQLDPDLQLAKQALAELQRRRW